MESVVLDAYSNKVLAYHEVVSTHALSSLNPDDPQPMTNLEETDVWTLRLVLLYKT